MVSIFNTHWAKILQKKTENVIIALGLSSFSLFLESFSQQKLGTERAMLMLHISNINSWMHYH